MPGRIWPGWDGAMAYGSREQRRGPSSWPVAGCLPGFLRLAWVGLDFGLGWEEASCDSASSSVLAVGWLWDVRVSCCNIY